MIKDSNVYDCKISIVADQLYIMGAHKRKLNILLYQNN